MKILIAHTNGLYLARMKALFECFGGDNKVYTAADGREALRLVQNLPELDMVCVNPQLPLVSGLEVLRHAGQHRPQIERLLTPQTVFPQLTEEIAQFVGVQFIEQDRLGNLFQDRKILQIPEAELAQMVEAA